MQPFWQIPFWTPIFTVLILIAVAWEVVWKAIALWRAARNGHLVWFIFILIINSLGILPIIYIVFFSRKRG